MDLSQTRPFSYNEMTPSRAAANRRRGKRRSQTSREAPGKHQSAQEELLVDEPDSGQSEDELLHVSSIIPRQVAGKRHFAVRIIRALTDWFSLRFGGNWVLLTLLGVVTALVAFAMDFCIRHILQLRFAMISYMASFPAYVAWLLFTVGLALFAVATTHYLEEHAIGSGIPQMKAIIQGTRIFNYLSQRTLLSKFVGTTFASGSGLPVGKEGPFVHMASIIAEQLMQMLFRVVHSNTTQRLEMLAAAAAVGVASNFGAPIGGVLFSIEVTSTYFAVRNYWRGFYASVVGAFVFRLLAVLIKDERTLTALFTTQFDEYPFDMQEMFAFTLLGALSGVVASLFVFTHRKFCELIVFVQNGSGKCARFWGNRYLETLCLSALIATLFCPQTLGKFMSLSQRQEIGQLFTTQPLHCLEDWKDRNVFSSLILFFLLKFFMTAIAVAFPIPAGVFFPVFVIGAGLGRLAGELMNLWFPEGFSGDVVDPWNTTDCGWSSPNHVVPGGYAVVGAAAVAGGVTHTISTSVIVFELTGQIHHILPVMIAVLVSNAIAQKLGPSFYDSVTQLKGLPYLPDLRSGALYNMTASHIMRKDIYSLSLESTFARLNYMLKNTDFQVYPIVERKDDKILVGSCSRVVLENLLGAHVERMETAGLAESQRGSEDQQRWEEHLRQRIDLTGVHIDPSPFQFTEHTSVHKVHSLFASLGVQFAYVTSIGRLTGVVGLADLTSALEGMGGIRKLERRTNRVHPHHEVKFVADAEDFTTSAV